MPKSLDNTFASIAANYLVEKTTFVIFSYTLLIGVIAVVFSLGIETLTPSDVSFMDIFIILLLGVVLVVTLSLLFKVLLKDALVHAIMHSPIPIGAAEVKALMVDKEEANPFNVTNEQIDVGTKIITPPFVERRKFPPVAEE